MLEAERSGAGMLLYKASVEPDHCRPMCSVNQGLGLIQRMGSHFQSAVQMSVNGSVQWYICYVLRSQPLL